MTTYDGGAGSNDCGARPIGAALIVSTTNASTLRPRSRT